MGYASVEFQELLLGSGTAWMRELRGGVGGRTEGEEKNDWECQATTEYA